MGQGTTFEKPGLVQVPVNSTVPHWKFGLRQLLMGKAPNLAITAHSSISLAGWAQKQDTERKK